MKIQWNKWVTILICIPLVVSLWSGFCEGVQSFDVEPSDITVQRGASVIFPCKIKDMKGVLQWTMNGFGLGTDRGLRSYPRYTMIGSNETGNYSLHISAALLADEATFQCQVSGTLEEPELQSKMAKLTVLYPPKDDPLQVYIDPESPVHAISGSKVRLTCRGGLTKPISKIQWYKDDEMIKKGVGESVNPLPNSMLESVTSWIDFTPDKSYHESNISCRVSHPALDDPIVRSVKMIVQFSPVVTIAKHFTRAKEGDTVKFTCTAKGNPANFRFRFEVNGITMHTDTETELVMTHLKKTDNNAKIACFVSNSIGNGETSLKLDVQYELTFAKEPEDVNGEEGEEVTLKCAVDSNPKAEIVWTSDDSQEVLGHGETWKIKASKETEGTYRCRATASGYPEISRTMKLFVRGPPLVYPDQHSFGSEDETSQVHCNIRSIPRPVEVIWSLNGASLDPKNSVKYDVSELKTREGIRHTLIIYETNDNDFVYYNCTAKNGYGSHTELIELRKQKNLPLVTTLVAITGGVIFLVIVAILVILFKKQGSAYKDPNTSNSIEKQSVRSSDHSSTHDSMLKSDSRTGTGSELSPSDEEDGFSQDEWSSDDPVTRRNLRKSPFEKTGDYGEVFLLKGPSSNHEGGYIPYVDYQRDYNPPPPPINRNSLHYSAQMLNNVDPRYSAAYGNPYLRVPPTANVAQEYGSTGRLLPAGLPDMNMTSQPSGFVGSQNNNLNNLNPNNKNIYNQINQTRNNNIRNNTINSSQYVLLPQSDTSLQTSVQGTHI